MINKQQLDNYFTNNYTKLIEVANAWIIKYKKKYDPYNVVTLLYIKLTEKMSQIEETTLENYIFTLLRNDIRWSRTRVEKDEVIKDTTLMFDIEEQGDHELDNKIQDEKNIEIKIQAIKMYRNQLVEKDKQIVFDAYIKEESNRKVRGLAKHFNELNVKHMNLSASYKYIKEFKQGINEIEKEIRNRNH